MKKIRKTVSLHKDEFEHARAKMVARGWERDGDDAGISRYVQELIRSDMAREGQFKRPKPVPAAAGHEVTRARLGRRVSKRRSQPSDPALKNSRGHLSS